MASRPERSLRRYFDSLYATLGPQGWWPAKSRLEVILGAILTQNTSWQNAALALKNLRKHKLLKLAGLRKASRGEIETLIKSAGFFRQKAGTIRSFLDWLEHRCAGSLAAMFRLPAPVLKNELMMIKGLGPETVDAILLYAGGHPHFVADAYTRRVLSRHGLLPENASYADAQQFLHSTLPPDPGLFNEFHALIVEVGKRHCRRSAPRCQGCPLERFLPDLPDKQRLPLPANPAGASSAEQLEARP